MAQQLGRRPSGLSSLPCLRTVVTGAAQGIGAAVGVAAATRGDAVFLGDIDETGVIEVASELSAAPASAGAARLDVTDPASVAAFVDAAVDVMGGVDVLVNAAGGFTRRLPAEDIEDDDWHRVIDLNLFGAFAMCRAVVPIMKQQSFGRILNVSSEAGRSPLFRSGAHYAAAKAGMIGMTRHLARELGASGICVNALAPGTTLTPRVRELYRDGGTEEIVGLTPLERLAEVDEVVAPIMFLTSEDASYITGAVLDVSGGRIMV